MFRGDDVALARIMHRAVEVARRLGHPRVGSEHLLLALVEDHGSLSDVWADHAISEQAIQNAVVATAPAGAAAAADRTTLAPLGVSIDRLLDSFGTAVLDRPPVKEPKFSLGVRRARQRCARSTPPVGLDVQAAYEASLRLAIARREHRHRPEHLAIALVALDPGVAWVLTKTGIDGRRLLCDLVNAFPPPQRNRPVHTTGSARQRLRCAAITRRYERTSGRTPVSGADALVTCLIG